ncbi:hypothetical protein GGS21DRAFT_499975 [Xylaria nigripes]|nr:hypothetical protein GGS21DRAFT_499975 [Xylaria nigripes]
MGLSKWKFGGGKHQILGAGNRDTATVKSAPTYDLSTNCKNNKYNNTCYNNHNHNGGNRTKSAPSPFSWIRASLKPKRRSIISRDDPAFARLHKPFTPQNLEHQKLLNAFEWHFHDDEHQQQRRLSFISSLSPCASRRPSMDNYALAYGPEERPLPPDTPCKTPEKGSQSPRFWDLRSANGILDRHTM